MTRKEVSEYAVWAGMKNRCTNDRNPNYVNYGARGIKVCQRWMESFDDFLVDMGPRPSMDHTIDRHPNNNGDYEPGNCRWATKEEQANNRRSNKLIVINGKEMTISEASKETGINYATLVTRVAKGLTGTDLLKSTNPETYTHDGLTLSLVGWSRRSGINVSVLRERIKRGLTISEALTKVSHLAPRTIRGQTKSLKEWVDLHGTDYKAVQWRLANGWDLEEALTIPVRPYST